MLHGSAGIGLATVVGMNRRRSPGPDPFVVLGLAASAGADDVIEARRRLAKSAHPDTGGTLAEMQRINAAAEQALAMLGGDLGSTSLPRTPSPPSSSSSRQDVGPPPSPDRRLRHDHPSFTVEALPVEAFEGLLIVASWLGEVISDDPPYGLEVALIDPIRGWCRLELVPDAGASTVSLALASEPGYPPPDIDDVRNLWVDGLNQLDWDHLDGGVSRPPP